MSIREAINRKPALGLAGAAGLIVLAIFAIYWNTRPVGSETGEVGSGLMHYTTDDGATWFVDSAEKYPQFIKDGKVAYRAHVYRDADGKEFVSCIERRSTSPAARQAQAARDAMTPEERELYPIGAAGMGGIELKRPGEKTWYNESDPRAQALLQPRSPSGKTEGLTFVQAW